MTPDFSKTANRIVRSEIREILKWTRKPGVISFGGGLPDASLFPIDDMISIADKILKEKGYLALQYGPTEGEQECIAAFIDFMKQHDDIADPGNVIVTSSSQQALDLLSLLFIDENSPIVMEIPSYLGGIQAFRRAGADMLGIHLDEEGMKINELQNLLDDQIKKGKKPRFIYTIPDYQNPSGITMSLERRKQLIETARKHKIPIVEDSPYRELSFDGRTLPSLWSLAGGKGIIMLKTLSKILFPGMRMGWLCAEPEIIDKIVMLKQSVDLCSPPFNQFIIAEFFRTGKMMDTIKKAVKCYKPKCELMLQCLEKYMPPEVTWSKPTGGMFLWLTLPESGDSLEILKQAIENNVAYVIGRPFHCDSSGKNTLRLNYSFPAMDEIEKGIQNLSSVIKQKIA